MKIAAFLAVAAHAQDDDRKVPPRHPLQRLAKLGVFYQNFFDEMVDYSDMKQGESDRRTVSFPSES